MALDKAIKSGKEKRKPYRRAKLHDASCRNHGSCSYCRDSRLYSTRKREIAAREQQIADTAAPSLADALIVLDEKIEQWTERIERRAA